MRRRRKKLSVTSESHKPLKSSTLKSPFKKKEEKASNNPLLIFAILPFLQSFKIFAFSRPFLNLPQKKRVFISYLKKAVLCNVIETQFVSNNHQEKAIHIFCLGKYLKCMNFLKVFIRLLKWHLWHFLFFLHFQ